MGIEAAQEFGFQQNAGGGSKDADFILQTVEVDARLASHGSVDHGEQRSGNVDVGDSPLEGGSGKTAEVGHHAPAQVDEQGVAAGPFLTQGLPYGSQSFQILVHVFRPDNNLFRSFQRGDAVQMRATEAVGMLVGKDEKLVVGALLYGMRQAVRQSFAKDYFLFTHLVNYKLPITDVTDYEGKGAFFIILWCKDSSFGNKTLSLSREILWEQGVSAICLLLFVISNL